VPVPSPLRRRIILGSVAATLPAALALAPRTARAAAYPGGRPIRLVVPVPAGGSTDVVARLLAVELSRELGTSVFVDNIPGAGGAVGSTRAANADPDGHTLILGFSTSHAIAPFIVKNLSYQPLRDFTPIGRVATLELCIFATPDFPAKDVRDLIAMSKQPGANIMYGSWGVGSTGHLMMESINYHAKARLTMVPYKGEAPTMQAVLSKEVPVGLQSLGVALPFIRSGKVKLLGVSSPRRSPFAPDTPTLIEQGIPVDLVAWSALFAPSRTPADVVDRLSVALQNSLRSPAFVKRMQELGMQVDPISRQAFAKRWGEDIDAWEKLVKIAGIKPE